MTTPVLATVRLASLTGNPADDADNDFAFEVTTLNSATADNLATALASFYNTVQVIPGTDYSVANFLSSVISRAANAATIDFYDLTGHLNGSAHASPVFTRNFTVGAIAAGSPIDLPAEVAVCLSFHADLTGIPEKSGATRPAARRKGRVFIGPLNNFSQTGVPVVVGAPIRDALAAAAITLSDAVGASQRVWSRTGAALYGPIVGGWIDNAFDTQRRRGEAYTARTLWTS